MVLSHPLPLIVDYYCSPFTLLILCFRYKNGNDPANPRYTPHTIKDVNCASPVKPDELLLMSVDGPRPYKPKADLKPNTDKKKSTRKKRAAKKVREKEGAKGLKSLYSKAFQATTLTVGCWRGCLRRASGLTKEQVKAVSNRINEGVHILNKTRSYLYKTLELYINTTVEIDDESSTLDLLLSKKYGRTALRTLSTLILNGKLDTRGRKTDNEKAKSCQELGEEMYNLLVKTVSRQVMVNIGLSLSIP
jgi:hypothetical protein